MYKAPPEFTRQLKAYDDKLFTKWNNKHARWEIWRECSIGSKRVMFIENEDGGYRPLDNRTLVLIGLMDLQKRGTVNVLADIDRYGEETKRDALRTIKEKRRDSLIRVKDDFRKQTSCDNFYGILPWQGRKARGVWSQRWSNEVRG